MIRVALAALLLAGCYRSFERGDPGELLRDASPPPRDAGPTDAFVPRDAGGGGLRFRRCDGAFGGSMGVSIECATTEVPRLWSDPGGETVTLAIERILPLSGRARAQLWLLQGGPGGSSLELELDAPLFLSSIPDVEILLVDHRGTGFADRLGCDREEGFGSAGGTLITAEEWPSCIASVRARFDSTALEQFSTTSAARDLAAVIERAREPGQPVFVYGVSYGTYWAQRLMQVAPDAADAVVLDSICSPLECELPVGFTLGHDSTGRQLLGECAADAGCRMRIGSADAVAWATSVLAGVDAGRCAAAVAAGWDGDSVRFSLGALLRIEGLRNAIPAFLRRLERCSPEDASALATLASTLLAEPSGDARSRLSFAPVLSEVVIRSELWDSPEASAAEYEAVLRSSLFTAPLDHGLGLFAEWSVGPRYATDEFYGLFAETARPLLMMNGTLDPQTTLVDATPTGTHYSGASQHFVVFDRAPHGTIFAGLGAGGSFETCGMQILAAFLASPDAPLDTSCRTTASTLDFADDSVATTLFGTPTLWEASTASPIVGPGVLEARARLRRLAQRPW